MKSLLAVTMGDPAGIGAEVVVKHFASIKNLGACGAFVIGSFECLSKALKECDLNLPMIQRRTYSEIEEKCEYLQVLDCDLVNFDDLVMGEINAKCGKAAVAYFEQAIDLALSKDIAGIVTCPLNKEAIHLAGFIDDIGHQEILIRRTGVKLCATMLMTENLKVAHLSTHLSLGEAVKYVKTPILIQKLKLTHSHLRRWMGKEPRIAVAALNPHGGEGGLLGQEEISEIKPAVEACRDQGLDVSGPYPADSIFYRAVAGEFDAVMALYHDQGHIAIKMHDFENSITGTMGIPFIRTSVDHGTAFDIAGQNKADARGLGRAIEAAKNMQSGTLA